MIDGLERVLQGSGLPGLPELREALREWLGGSGGKGRFLDQTALPPRSQRVFRLRFRSGGRARSVVIKRLKPEIARRNELVAKRWLPAIGLGGNGPALLASAAARGGACVWHLYRDLGPRELDPRSADRESVRRAIDLIARMHTRFAGHPLLGEVRLHGGDLGIRFCEASVRDALHALEAWRPRRARRPLRDRLLGRLKTLRAELPRRARALAGPETLLHGDLWAVNVFVTPTPKGPHARLIDWDHAAAGPATYDLSTFLLRFPARERPWVMDLYRQAVGRDGWRLPAERDLNLAFETHELARIANRIIWPSIALVMDRADWGFEDLTEVERWFETLEPALPDTPGAAA